MRTFKAFPYCGFFDAECNTPTQAGVNDNLNDVLFNDVTDSLNHYMQNGVQVLSLQSKVEFSFDTIGSFGPATKTIPALGTERKTKMNGVGTMSVSPVFKIPDGLTHYYIKCEIAWQNFDDLQHIKLTLGTQDTTSSATLEQVILDGWNGATPLTYTSLPKTNLFGGSGNISTTPDQVEGIFIFTDNDKLDTDLIGSLQSRFSVMLIEYENVNLNTGAVDNFGVNEPLSSKDLIHPLTGQVFNSSGLLNLELWLYTE